MTTRTLEIELPAAVAEELAALVEEGLFASEAEAVRLALAEYLRRRPFELQERFQREDMAWGLGQTDAEETPADPSGERDRFVEAVEEGLADAEAGRVISDEELGRHLDEHLGSLGVGDLKKRLRKDRPMTTVSLRMPEDVVQDLERIAPRLGFSGYLPLVRAYVGQGLRRDLAPSHGTDEPAEHSGRPAPPGSATGKASPSTHKRAENPRPVRRRPPTHPGEILREDVLPEPRLSVAEAARQLRVPRHTLRRVLAGSSPVTAEMALRLGRFCGNGPDLWLRLQQSHDLWHARARLGAELETIPEHQGMPAGGERAKDTD